MPRIQTNVSALNANRNLARTTTALERSIQKLSSGFRINRAADDAAGLAIANKLRADLRSMRQAGRNAAQASSLLSVAEGGLSTISSILDRMKELATQAASDNVGQERPKLDDEYQRLISEIDRIAATTTFNGSRLINGDFGNTLDTNVANSTALAAGTGVFDVTLSGTADGTYSLTSAAGTAGKVTVTKGAVSQTSAALSNGKQDVTFSTFGLTLKLDANFTASTGAAAASLDGTAVVVKAGVSGGSFLVSSSGSYAANDQISLDNIDVTTATLGLTTDITSLANAQTALTEVDTAISSLSSNLGKVGAAQSRIEFASFNVSATIENVSAAQSVIRDADLATEMIDFTKNQILQQAGVAMLAQANAAPQSILSLLSG